MTAAGGTTVHADDLDETEVIVGLAKPMSVVGAFMTVLGAVGGIIGITTIQTGVGFVAIGQGIAALVLGGWLSSAAVALQRAATTDGCDMPTLLVALRKLRSVFTLQAWLLAITAAVLALALVTALDHPSGRW